MMGRDTHQDRQMPYTLARVASSAPTEGGEGGKGKLEDDVEGTGMGEGEGKQDVSEELKEHSFDV